MAHELSIQNGMVEMMYAGEVPWHGLGTQVNGLQTSQEAIQAAHLDWEVELRDVYVPTTKQLHPEVPVGELIKANAFATVRNDTNGILGIVGNRYNVLQNREAFGFFDELVGRDRAIYETAGAIKDGKRIWMLAKVGHVMEILPNDLVQQYCLLTHSHDGSLPISVYWTPVRVVCANTLQMAAQNEVKVVSLKHTTNVAGKLRLAAELLKSSYMHMQEVGMAAQRFASVTISDAEVNEYYENFFGIKEIEEKDEPSSRILKIRREKVADVLAIYHGTDFGQSLPGVEGTVWGGYSALNAWINHVMSKKVSQKNDSVNSLFFGNSYNHNLKAFNMALELCKG